MVLVSQNNEILNFDNIVSVRQQGQYIFGKTVYGGDITLGRYDTERAEEVLRTFISEMYDTPFTMIARYAFPEK